jgi:hypothetical protein
MYTLAWRDKDYRVYSPLTDEPALFRILADTPATAEGILSFASRFGSLGAPAAWPIEPVAPEQNKPDTLLLYWDITQVGWKGRGLPERWAKLIEPFAGIGEPLFVWGQTIAWLAHLTHLWDLAEANDQRGLAPFVRWHGEEIIHTFPPLKGPHRPMDEESGWRLRGRRVMQNRHRNGEPLNRRGDLVGPARQFVTTAVDLELKSKVETRLRWDARTGMPGLVQRTMSLVGAVWLQFALVVGGGTPPRRCPACRRWFVVGADAPNRIDRQTCSDSCRVKLHRLRRAAKEMHAGGKSAEQIAQALKSDVKTIKAWIKGTKEK